ncbi:MAG: carbamate kinase [Candidatus Thermoplasmatota archaeon]
MRTAVVAIGGNALVKETQKGTAEEQFENALALSEQLVEILRFYNIVITHGNGPQIGNILLANEAAEEAPPMPLDICSAYSQGSIGYVLQQALGSKLREKGVKKSIATIITQVIVDKNDSSFQNPTKPIGPFYTKEQAEELIRVRNWKVVEDAGRGYRRVVPSPKPVDIVEKELIKKLVASGELVIACGGGGIPVIKEKNILKGVAAVIDKDLSSSLLASLIGAELFLILTYVDKVAINFNRPNQKWLDKITIRDAKKYLAEGHFSPGSMGPKIQASINFLEKGGKKVIITSLEKAKDAVYGRAGTEIIPVPWF